MIRSVVIIGSGNLAEALARAVAEAENAGIEAADLHAMLDVLLEEN